MALKLTQFNMVGSDKGFIVCDWCGAGIGEQSLQVDIDTFITDHTNCDNTENTDLAFLDTDEEYIP